MEILLHIDSRLTGQQGPSRGATTFSASGHRS